MRIFKTSSNLAQPNVPVLAAAEVVIQEAQLPVGLVLVNVGTPGLNSTLSYILVNRSGGGEVIRVGFAPSFAPVAGISLNVGESVTINSLANPLNAIASGAGGLLDRFVVSP